MTARRRRQERILELLAEYEVRNQVELQELLAAEGVEVTQATLSRDLRELEVVKGTHGYVVPGTQAYEPPDEDALARAFRREAIQAEAGGPTLVLRTRPGHANALAVEIDRARLPDVLGTIAGDDTIFLAARSERHARTLLARIRSWIDG